MARPIKLGLDYFPHDTHSNDDTALALIEAEFGIAGYAVYFKLLEFIYSQGYAALWGADERSLFYHKLGAVGVSERKASEIIKGLVRRSLFDKGVLNSFQILTSKSIQLRWLEARRKKIDDIDPRVCLVEQTAKGISSLRLRISKNKQGVFATETTSNERVFTTETTLNEGVFATETPQIKEKKRNNSSSNSNNAREMENEAAQGALNLEPLQPAGSTRTGATIREMLTSSPIWTQQVCMHHGISPEALGEYVTKFEQHCFIESHAHNTDGDVQRHFNSWLRIHLSTQAPNKPSKQSNNGTSKNYRPSADDNRRRQEERTANIERRLQEAIYDTSDIPAGSY
nr:MAG TPA: protein of unknown function (DUF4373) [Caudoviricetes sp.]